MPTTFVRVRDELGNEFSVPEDSPFLLDDYEILHNEPSSDGQGHALPPYVAPTPEVDADGEPLRGHALDEALDEAGLTKTGTVAEKQARLAEHNAGIDPEENV